MLLNASSRRTGCCGRASRSRFFGSPDAVLRRTHAPQCHPIHALRCMHAGAVWCNGPACGNPAAFTNVAMTVAQYGSYVEGVRANLMAGGDNCSRSCLIGALLAAQVRARARVRACMHACAHPDQMRCRCAAAAVFKAASAIHMHTCIHDLALCCLCADECVRVSLPPVC